MGAIQLLPDLTREERVKIRATLAGIRARMSLEQLAQLQHHETLLDRYGHLLEVYLEPVRFVDLAGLNDDEKAAKILATQRQALGRLLPTARDTLAGAIKTLSDALQLIITLKRKIVCLDNVKTGTGGSQPSDPLVADEEKSPLVNLDSMSTEDVRAVHHAMELLDRHRYKRQDAPTPPIDDLMTDPTQPDGPKVPAIPPR